MAKQRYTADEMIGAIQKARGLLSVTANRLGCTRQKVENYVNRYPTVARAVVEEREKLIDVAEAKLFEQIQEGEQWAVQFVLKTLGKRRGYVERQEITGAESGPITLRVVYDDRIDS